jgi:hypothetical protein
MDKNLPELPFGWKVHSAWSNVGSRREHKCYIFTNKEIGGYKKFSYSWTIQSQTDAFNAFLEWHKEAYGKQNV